MKIEPTKEKMACPNIVERVIKEAKDLHAYMESDQKVNNDLNRASNNFPQHPPMTPERFFSLKLTNPHIPTERCSYRDYLEGLKNIKK